jgi:hypothetical protein
MGDSNAGEHEWTDQKLKDVLRYLLRHVVGFALTYRRRMKEGIVSVDGEWEDKDQFCFFSAFVITIRDRW